MKNLYLVDEETWLNLKDNEGYFCDRDLIDYYYNIKCKVIGYMNSSIITISNTEVVAGALARELDMDYNINNNIYLYKIKKIIRPNKPYAIKLIFGCINDMSVEEFETL